MYKKIYHKVKLIILDPALSWKDLEVNDEQESNPVTDYFLPLLLAGTFSFIIGLLVFQNSDIQLVIKKSVVHFLSFFGGFFLSVFCIKTFIQKRYKREVDINKINRFVAYSSTIMLVVNIIVGLFPNDLFFMKIFNVYTFYVISQGVALWDIEEKEQSLFVLFTAAVILFSPSVIKEILILMMPGMNV